MLTFKDLPEGWYLLKKGEEGRQIDIFALSYSNFRISIERHNRVTTPKVSPDYWYVDYTVLDKKGEFNEWKAASGELETEEQAIHWALITIKTGLYKDWL